MLKTVFLAALLAIGTLLGRGCRNDLRDVQVEGIVIDPTTQQPVPGAAVQIGCMRWQGFQTAGFGHYKTLYDTTDQAGRFSARFERGNKVAVFIEKPGYDSFLDSQELRFGPQARFQAWLVRDSVGVR